MPLKSHLGLLSACVLVATMALTAPAVGKPNDPNHWVMTVQDFPAAPAWGAGAIIPLEMPYVPSFTIKGEQFASVTQLAIGSCDSDELKRCRIIEYGWMVDPVAYSGDARPHMFLALRGGSEINVICFIKKFGVCEQPSYAGGKPFENAFVAVAGAEAYPDDPLDGSGNALFYVGYYPGNNAWWVQYKDKWIGYIHDTGGYFSQRFDGARWVHWYGETMTPQENEFPDLCSNVSTSQCACIYMGNGYIGTDARSAQITNMIYLDSATGTIQLAHARLDKITTSDSTVYSGGLYTSNGERAPEDGPFDAFHYGGEGWNCSIAR